MASKHTRNSPAGMANCLIGGKYRIVKPIGSGSFGDLYYGINTQDGCDVAIKIESVDTKFPQLMYEAKVYQHLNNMTGVPTLIHHGCEKGYSAMVMELLGPSLEDLFNNCKRRFSLKTVLMLCDQLLTRVEGVHKAGFIHRDVKPDNFLMGLGGNSNKLYMVDFGLAKRYQDMSTGTHIAYRDDRNLTGTVRYASINAQMGVEQSRRDDLESMSYCIMYFNLGKLPWQGVVAENKKQKYEKILEKKNLITIADLCKGWPAEFALFMKYCRNLRFTDVPDYVYLRQIFRILFRTLNHHYDYQFDWTLLRQQKERVRRERQQQTDQSDQTLVRSNGQKYDRIGDGLSYKKK